MTGKKNLSERDICSKYITPAITAAGWDLLTQIREEVSFTKGRIIVRGNAPLAMKVLLNLLNLLNDLEIVKVIHEWRNAAGEAKSATGQQQ